MPGVLFGATALIRPEYLIVGIAFAVLALIRVGRAGGWRPGLVSAALLAVGLLHPDRSLDDPQRDRPCTAPCRSRPGTARPSTSAPSSPPTANTRRSRRCSSRRYLHRDLEPALAGAGRSRPHPALQSRRRPLPRPAARLGPGQDRQAELLPLLRRRPDRLPGDDRAQGRADVEQRRRRSDGQHRRTRDPDPDRGARRWPASGVLAWRRRWWELIAMATPIVLVTAVGAVSLAAPRRNEVLMTLVFPLAAAALCRAAAALLSNRRWPSTQASSPPN